MPSVPGQERLIGLLMHAKDLNPQAQELSQAKEVVVQDGNKSAYDACYLVARNGGVAHMVLSP